MAATDQADGPREPELKGWADYFMGMALLAGHRSKDPKIQVGACIVNENNQIMGVGYNGMPMGLSDEINKPWDPDYVCHAAINAVLLSTTADLKGCTLYTTHFPCKDCVKYLVQKHIGGVVYYSKTMVEERNRDKADKMFSSAIPKIEPREYDRKNPDILAARFGLTRLYGDTLGASLSTPVQVSPP